MAPTGISAKLGEGSSSGQQAAGPAESQVQSFDHSLFAATYDSPAAKPSEYQDFTCQLECKQPHDDAGDPKTWPAVVHGIIGRSCFRKSVVLETPLLYRTDGIADVTVGSDVLMYGTPEISMGS